MSQKVTSYSIPVTGLVVSIIILLALIPHVNQAFGDVPSGRGVRPLIIIATQGGNTPYSVSGRANVSEDGNITLTVVLLEEEWEEKEVPLQSRPYARVQIIVVGDDVEGNVRCGENLELVAPISIAKLSPGPAYAVEIDSKSGLSSALAPPKDQAEDPVVDNKLQEDTPSLPSDPAEDFTAEVEAVQYEVEMYGWKYEERQTLQKYRMERSVNGEGYVFQEKCTLDKELLWSASENDDPMGEPLVTFLAPQFNLTSIEESTDYQSSFEILLSLDRAPGVALLESYPQPEVKSAGWHYPYEIYWYEKTGGKGYMGYTDQPTWILANRYSAMKNELWLFYGGLGLGLSMSLFMSSTLKILEVRQARESARRN